MFGTGSLVFVQFSERGMLRAAVLEHTDNTITAEFTEQIRPVVGSAVQLFWHADESVKRNFMRASARVQAYLRADPNAVIRFLVTSESEPTEFRQGFRVSVAGAGLTIDIDDEKECPLLDVSALGFGVTASSIFEIGTILQATCNDKGVKFTGKAVVRSIYKRDDGRFRYGCEALEREHDLQRGLQKISTTVQREQLRRARE